MACLLPLTCIFFPTSSSSSQCGAVFDDGSEFPCDVIIACTGYRNSFPIFLDPAHADEPVAGATGGITYKDLARELTNPRLLFKQCLHPAFNDGSLAVMGFARPAFGSIPPCSEMQVHGRFEVFARRRIAVLSLRIFAKA